MGQKFMLAWFGAGFVLTTAFVLLVLYSLAPAGEDVGGTDFLYAAVIGLAGGGLNLSAYGIWRSLG